jgi:BirA family transcriptional regulator, biotin operon repressor / biotin---[acetyl-CoA-carboxylase] ligase
VIRTVALTGSTNADMIALASSGAPEGTWLRAEQQSGGRGRMGRGWQSPPGNLYASTIVRLQPNDPVAPTLALVAAVALAETVQAYAPSVAVTIKWPNDLLICGAKIAGILLERVGDAVVVGIGVNLVHHPEGLDRPVTDLAAQGHQVDSAAFTQDLAEGFARWVARWRSEGIASVRVAWLLAAHQLGTALFANLGDGDAVEGLFDGLTEDGALRLRLADGAVRVIHAGDIFLI